MQIVLWRGGFSSSRHISRIRWLDSLILLPLVFLRKLHLLYMIAVLLTFFEIAYDSSLSYDLKVYLSSFYKAISTHVKIYLIVILIYISQWLVMLNIKIYTVVICMSFEKCLFKSSDQFFWVSVYVCVFVCIYTCVCVCVYTCLDRCTPLWMNIWRAEVSTKCCPLLSSVFFFSSFSFLFWLLI